MTPPAAGPATTTSSGELAEVAGYFDADFYRAAHPSLSGTDEQLLRHFCDHGWRELRKPRRDFDVWWYWANHLDPAVEEVNPLLHYARIGQGLGLSTRPDPRAALGGAGARLPDDRPVRRAVLFAAFDVDGIVDESVLRYLRELARFGDVFCLYDHYLPVDELAKLDDITAGSWGIRHGAYDFGSYAMLARDLVGWDRLAGYDEVLFVNDSCYLLRPLDQVFESMSAQACDWWGLQATKGLALTRGTPNNVFTEPIPLDQVREDLLPGYEDDAVYDFHLGSYFLCFRRPVLDDPVFRRLVGSVSPQRDKLSIIQKYEIGITHLLLGRGHDFATFVPELYPFHPMFTRWAFDLVESGFPMLKKLLLYLNHYDVPGVGDWRSRVVGSVPEAPLDLYESSLLRTSPDDQLQRSRAVTATARGKVRVPEQLSGGAFAERDKVTPKRADLYAFAVDPITHRLPENSVALLDRLSQDPEVETVVLTRSRRLELPGRAVRSVPATSPAGRQILLEAGLVFVPETSSDSLGVALSRARHHVIAVRGGLSLIRRGSTAAAARTPSPHRQKPTGPLEMLHPARRRSLTAVLTASAVDQMAEIAELFPARYADAWRTGLPVHDLLVCEQPPPGIAAQEEAVRRLLAGRRLLLFAPEGAGPAIGRPAYEFGPAALDRLSDWADAHDVVLGLREPVDDLHRPYSRQFGSRVLDLSPQRVPSLTAVLRSSDVLLTDYSGSAFDFTVTGRPVLGFAPDATAVADRLLYDLDHLFPGPVTRSFDELEAALATVFEPAAAIRRQYERVRALLIDHLDAGSTDRVLEQVRRLQEESLG